MCKEFFFDNDSQIFLGNISYKATAHLHIAYLGLYYFVLFIFILFVKLYCQNIDFI